MLFFWGLVYVSKLCKSLTFLEGVTFSISENNRQACNEMLLKDLSYLLATCPSDLILRGAKYENFTQPRNKMCFYNHIML
jgi:hypothetical protein